MSDDIFNDRLWITRGHKRILSFIGHPIEGAMDLVELNIYLRHRGAQIAMWNYDPDYAEEGPWYRCICDNPRYDYSAIPSQNVRHNIKRSLARCQVRKVEFSWLAENGYKVYKAASKRFTGYKSMSEERFRAEMVRNEAFGNRAAVAVFAYGSLAAFMTMIDAKKVLFGDKAYFDPAFSSAYPMYALYYTVAKDAMSNGYLAFDRGSKPLVHETGVDEFLRRMGFRFSYCRLGFFALNRHLLALRLGGWLISHIPALGATGLGKGIAGLNEAYMCAQATGFDR